MGDSTSGWAGLTTTQWRWIVYLAFAALMIEVGARATADDLAGQYIGCRLVTAGRWSELYAHHQSMFGAVSAEHWAALKKLPRFRGFVASYIQTPALVWALQPVCRGVEWPGFIAMNACLQAVSLIAGVELVARRWARPFLNPFWMAALLAAAAFTTPVRYEILLGQIQFSILTLSLFALAGKSDRRAALSGFALALAAAIKVTPAALLLHLAMVGKVRTAAWCVAGSVALLCLGVIVGGLNEFRQYQHVLGGFSNGLFVEWDNQSLAVALSPASLTELLDWRPIPFPWLLKVVSGAGALITPVVGGLLARRPGKEGLGACFSLVGLTVFAPLAWVHYFLVLIPAAMLLLAKPSTWRVASALAIFIFSILPITVGAAEPAAAHFMPRALCIAGLIALVALAAAALQPDELRTQSGDRDHLPEQPTP